MREERLKVMVLEEEVEAEVQNEFPKVVVGEEEEVAMPNNINELLTRRDLRRRGH